MTRRSAVLALAACFLQGDAASVQLESESPSLRPEWRVVASTPRDTMIDLTFAIKQQGLQELHDTLMAVSMPDSPRYGAHLSNDEVQRLTAPKPEHFKAVLDFLVSHGVKVSDATPNGDLISVSVPVETAEKMLSAKYMQVKHGRTGQEVTRTPGGYSLPEDVAKAIDFVSPTMHIPGVAKPVLGEQKGNAELGDSEFNSPKNLRELYSVGSVEGKAANNKQAVTAFLDQQYELNSLQKFWDKFCSGITCGKGQPKLVGDETTGTPGVEAMLDIETITGVAGNVESEFWGFSGNSPDNPQNEPFMKWLTLLSKTSDADVPKIFSSSYGEDEGSWSYSAAQRLNVEFQKAGVRGISLLYAAGDEGANCKEGKFVPEGPGSSPYVTAVGGTSQTDCWPSPKCEKAIGLGSGGFSNYWPMPDYQKEAVANYLKQSDLPDPKFGYNTSGRAYPDISAQASNYYVYADGPEPGVAGTSCATPAASGIFALLNDLRLQNGKSTLGFLNPLVYKYASAFNDVTTGSNDGGSCGEGWPATKGWDAATGVGTPNYAELVKAVSNLPAGKGKNVAAASDVETVVV
eukprot:TRINITY_DN1045_c0_g1_i2.p1 TRINITY_DN1045_c0_g1~~TRINITY_DN1045_c0_g1_i2.p1  ORF type:complete len:601 (-),score=132.18 TRINITY_DN1045_c0_g1_i2:405-2129(-)